MKITYIRLKNFAAVHTGMHQKEIEIDMSRCKNNIVLIVGPNGSGKTALLSTLHPFAYPDNGDQRSNSTMILKDHDGEKEIHYDVDGDLYVIKHFYKQSTRGTITKSFISKNGEELNPNGNVSSFMEIVFIELGIRSDYMKLLRLGSNVTNLIDLKASDRKKSTIGLFSELDIWSTYYKKVNEETRLLKNLLNTAMNKLQRLNVDSVDELTSRIEQTTREIVKTTQNISDLKESLGSINGTISTMFPEGVETFKLKHQASINQYNSLMKDIESVKKKLSSIGIIVIGDIETTISSLTNKAISIKANIDMVKGIIDSNNSKLNNYMNQLDKVEHELQTSMSDEHIESLKQLKDTLNKDISMYPERIRKYKPTTTKDNLLTVINILHEIDRIASETYGFGKGAIRECIDVLRRGVDVDKYVNESINKIDDEINGIRIKLKGSNVYRDNIVVFRPSNCPTDTCPFMKIYDLISGNDDGKTPSVKALEQDRDKLINISAINTNLRYIKSICEANKHIIKTLDELNINYLSYDVILDNIYKDKPLFNESAITSIISDIEEYNDYNSLCEKLKDVELSLMKASNNNGNTMVLEEKRRSICEQIQSLRQDIHNDKEKIEKLTKEHTDTIDTLETYKEYNELLCMCDKYDEEANIIHEEIVSNSDKFDVLQDKINTRQLITNQLAYSENKLKELSDDEFNDKYKLKSYKTLMRERELINEKYEAYATAREALSPTKDGIQSVCVYLYLESTIMTVNEILSTVYDNFQVVKFDIGDNEFNIPYVKNDVMINDISFASQGERSFLNIALSFALMEKAIDKYNVPLFDEIDATLDMRNRAMFLNIVLDRIEAMNAEQLFMITHNNMFDSYPVDIIMTGDINLDSYKNANIIYTNK